MFKGSVSFVAQIKDQRVTFSHLDFNPDKPGLEVHVENARILKIIQPYTRP